MLRLQSALSLRRPHQQSNSFLLFKQNNLQRGSVEVVKGRTGSLLTTQPSRGFVAMIARGGAGVVAALGIVYIAYEAAIRLEMTQMRSIRKTIYKPQAELMSFNPGSLFLPRPDKTAFLAEVFSADPSGPILITGPQGSGKTAAIKQVLKGRFQTVYLDLRAQPVTTGEALTLAFVEQAGFLMPPRELVGRAVFAASATSSQTASFEIEKAFRLIREVLRADKASGLRGWISPGSNGQPVITPPLLCIDELNVSDVSALSEDPAFWRFIEWSLYMTDNRLANVAISCSTEVAEMLDAHPGFRARRHRIFFDFPRAKSVAHYFKNVVNTQLRDVCGATPRPGGPMAKAISEAAAAKAKASAVAAAAAAEAAAQAAANGQSSTGSSPLSSNSTSSSFSLWSLFFGSPNISQVQNSTSTNKGVDSIDQTILKTSGSGVEKSLATNLTSSSSTTVSASTLMTNNTSSRSPLMSPEVIISAVSTPALQDAQVTGTKTAATLSSTPPPTLTMVAQLEGEGPSAAFSFARAAALAAQTERDKTAAAAAAAAASVSSTATAVPSTGASAINGPIAVTITSNVTSPLSPSNMELSPEVASVTSALSSSSSSSQGISLNNTSTLSNDGANINSLPSLGQSSPSSHGATVSVSTELELNTKTMSTENTISGRSNTTDAASSTDVNQSQLNESTPIKQNERRDVTISSAASHPTSSQPFSSSSSIREDSLSSSASNSSNAITTQVPNQPVLTTMSTPLSSTLTSTTNSATLPISSPSTDRLSQSSLINYFVYGSRYEFAPWGRTQSRYYLLEDHEIARIVETIGGNLKDLHTVVASIMAGKHWASALERLVADSADMVESTLDVLLAASSSDSSSSLSAGGGGGAAASAASGAATGTGNPVSSASGGNRAGGGRRGLRLRLLARAPLPQWDFAANPRPDRLAAYSRFLRAWDLMIELDKRKYVQRRELVDSIFAGCPHELEYLVDVGLAVAVNIKGMTRVANGGSSAQAQVAIEQFGIGKDGAVVTKVPGVYIAAASPRLRMAFRSLTRDALLVRHAARVRASVRLAHLRIEEARLSTKLMPDATVERSYWHSQVQQLLVRDTTLRSAVARELIALQAAAPVTAVDFLTKGTMTPEALKEGEGAPPELAAEETGRGESRKAEAAKTQIQTTLSTLDSKTSTSQTSIGGTPTSSSSSSSFPFRNWNLREDPLSGVSEVPLLGASALSGQLEVALQSMREAENEVRSLRSRLAEIRNEIANEEAKVRILYETAPRDGSSSSPSTTSSLDRPDRDLAVSWVLDGGFVPLNSTFPSPPVATNSAASATTNAVTTTAPGPSSALSSSSLNGDTSSMTNSSSRERDSSKINNNNHKMVYDESSMSGTSSSTTSISSSSTSMSSTPDSSRLTETYSTSSSSTTPFTSASSGYYGSYQFLAEDKEEEDDDDDEEDSEEEEEAGGAAWAARRQNKHAARQQQKREQDSVASTSTNTFGTRRNFDRTEGEGSSANTAAKPPKKQRAVRSGSTKGAGEAQRKLGYSGWYKASNDREER
jgi:trimeric autotransporter adhesin